MHEPQQSCIPGEEGEVGRSAHYCLVEELHVPGGEEERRREREGGREGGREERRKGGKEGERGRTRGWKEGGKRREGEDNYLYVVCECVCVYVKPQVLIKQHIPS